MKLNKNYTDFPKHFYAPQEIEVDDRTYNKFLIRFDNLFEIYDFLKGDYVINRNIFHELSSENGEYKFAGIPYEDAVEDLINFNEDGYTDFLNLVKELANVKAGDIHEYELQKTLAGGHLNIPAYSVGSPLCYETYRKVKRPKYVSIHASLSYPWYTNKKQVLNRALILVSIINALERNGYEVNLNTFELSDEYKELLNIVVNVKQYGRKTNLQTLYKTNCHVEFLRRILFRILEATSVTCDWADGYGHTCSEIFARKVLNIGKDDIYFGTPDDLGIKGKDLSKDFNSCLETLNLNNKFNVRQISDEFKEKAKRLIK